MAITSTPQAPLTKEEREMELIKYGIRMAAITICVVILSMSSCSTLDFVDEDRAKVKTAEYEGNVKLAQQKHTEEMAKIAAIEKLIKEQKVDPIAARCAINGWDRSTEDVCKVAVTGEPEKGVSVNITTKQAEK